MGITQRLSINNVSQIFAFLDPLLVNARIWLTPSSSLLVRILPIKIYLQKLSIFTDFDIEYTNIQY